MQLFLVTGSKEKKISTYSSTILANHSSSAEILAYSSLNNFCTFLASFQQLLGNGLGNKVVGACVARRPFGLFTTKDGGGRTIKPCDKDQSVEASIIYESCSGASKGGYGGKIEGAIIVAVV